MPRFILILFSLVLFALPAHAADAEAALYHRAFLALADNNPVQAEAFAAHGRDPVLNKVVRGYAMALPGNDYTFDELDAFIAKNPDWPGLKGIQMMAERKIPADAAPGMITAWFSAHSPVTLVGFYRYVEALNQSGQAQAAAAAVRDRWIQNDFTGDEQTAFYDRFGSLLDGNAMWARMDRLLWKNDESGARRMMPYVDGGQKMVAEARLAMAQQQSNADIWLSRIPSSAENDPGLLYQRLHWQVHNNRDDEADDILLHPPGELGNAAEWWEMRQIMVRRAMQKHDYNLAYRLAENHGQSEAKTLVQGEFLCGWLALRFLNQPDAARQHFQNLYDNASTPISRARGAYWLGRAYDMTGDKNAATQAYQDAATFNTTYYGQLALTQLEDAPVLTAKADPRLPDAIRRTFLSRELVRAALRLNDIGEFDRAHSFFHAALETANDRSDFIMLAEVAAMMHRPDLGIQTVKAANQKNILVENGGFPLIDEHVPSPPEAAFTHALIRQESMFNPAAESAVGARGLMQLMPRTAKDVAKKINVRYSETRLNEPGYSLKLGTSFVQEQIDHFDGSYVLALAGYNAGPARAREWMTEFGDPRSADVDAIDWVESIPLQETRNYVQRIIESIQVYRAKLAGGHAPLLIIKDLKR